MRYRGQITTRTPKAHAFIEQQLTRANLGWFRAVRGIEAKSARAGLNRSRVCSSSTTKECGSRDLRFPPGDAALVPLLAVPALKGREPDGNVVAWARQREDGGRGFGTTCGHFYDNWQHADFRKLVLNGLVWSAGVEVPASGVEARYFERDWRYAPEVPPHPSLPEITARRGLL